MWSNYKIGYHIMESFLKGNNHISVEEWTNLAAVNIRRKSGLSYILTMFGE
jgi:uncharacterized protein YjaZ